MLLHGYKHSRFYSCSLSLTSTERASDAQPEQRRHHLQPQPGAPEGDPVPSRQLHLRGQQRRRGRGFESRRHHHHV